MFDIGMRSAYQQYSENQLSWVQISIEARCSFFVCHMCLQARCFAVIYLLARRTTSFSHPTPSFILSILLASYQTFVHHN